MRVRLGGLDVADVQELVHRSGDSARGADGELAEQLVELTDGNAFLVGEVWRHMLDQEGVAGRSSPADATIPESVREVMADRVAGLTPALSELLQLIAVSPRGIALPVLRAAAGMEDEPLLGALDEGLHTGMLDEIRDASLVYRVRHELLRRTVYERLSSFRAATLHLRVGEALEAMPEGRRDRIVNELAFHFRAAAPIAGNGRAVDVRARGGGPGGALARLRRGGRSTRGGARPRRPRPLRRGGGPLPAGAGVASRRAARRGAGELRRRRGGRARVRRRSAAGPRGHRIRDRLLAPGHRRPACRGPAAGGRPRHRRRAQRATGTRAGAPEPRPRLPARARRGGRVLVAGGGDGPARGRPGRAHGRALPRRMDARLARARRDPGRSHRSRRAGAHASPRPRVRRRQRHAQRAADRGLRHRRGARGHGRAPRAVRTRRAALPRGGRRATRRDPRPLRRPARRGRGGREPRRRDRPAGSRGAPRRCTGSRCSASAASRDDSARSRPWSASSRRQETETDSLWRPALAVLLAEIGDVEAARRELEDARRRRPRGHPPGRTRCRRSDLRWPTHAPSSRTTRSPRRSTSSCSASRARTW